MFGIIRPCRHRLGGELAAAWTAQLCGLCLALRDDYGQAARVATNYDGLVVSRKGQQEPINFGDQPAQPADDGETPNPKRKSGGDGTGCWCCCEGCDCCCDDCCCDCS